MITIISALSQNKVIWNKNSLPWYYEEDILRFREFIKGKNIVMWKNTFLSLKKHFPESNWHPLASKNIVLSTTLENVAWIEIYKDIQDILKKYKNDDLVIIGWEQIYKSFLPYSNYLELTLISWEFLWDTFFPDFKESFELISEEKWKNKDLIFQRRKRKKHKIFLWLWTNIWNKEQNLKEAISFLRTNISNIKESKMYKTKPFWELNQDNFLNMVISWYTNLDHLELLEFVKNTEDQIWRTKTYRWWPRIIDIDILFFDDLIFERENLIIPHIWIEFRDFVLKPFLDLEPNFIHPKTKKTIKELYENLSSKDFTII